jgi:hypothetical protein
MKGWLCLHMQNSIHADSIRRTAVK